MAIMVIMAYTVLLKELCLLVTKRNNTPGIKTIIVHRYSSLFIFIIYIPNSKYTGCF